LTVVIIVIFVRKISKEEKEILSSDKEMGYETNTYFLEKQKKKYFWESFFFM